MLFTKSVHQPKGPEDGIRILIARRDQLKGISSDSYNSHAVHLAPPVTLERDRTDIAMTPNHFDVRYHNYLVHSGVGKDIKILATQAIDQDITLVSVEENPAYSPFRVLEEECKRYQPSLKIVHR